MKRARLRIIMLMGIVLLSLAVIVSCKGTETEPKTDTGTQTDTEIPTVPDTDALGETGAVDTHTDTETADGTEIDTEPATEPETQPLLDTYEETFGDIRIQLYSNTALRIEKARRGNFCDENTLAVRNRTAWAGVSVTRTETDGTVLLTTPGYTVSVSADSSDLNDVTVLDSDGNVIWKYADHRQETVNTFLPAPGETGAAWSFNDSPRTVMSDMGFALPDSQNEYEKNNGWIHETNVRDYYVFVPQGDTFTLRRDVVRLTGGCDLPTVKALGFWFSRFYPYSDREVLALIDTFRKKGYPIDYFVCDTDWRVGSSTGYDINTSFFPNAKRFFTNAHNKNVRIAFNDHVRDYNESVLSYNQLKWFNQNLTSLLDKGLDTWWYDRNWGYGLISPFEGINPDLLGQEMYLSIMNEHRPAQRNVMLSNIYWVGNGTYSAPGHIASYRYGLQWTGDIQSYAAILEKELRNMVSIGALTPLGYISSDIGGHLGNPDEFLFIRWSQYGALSPVMRYHSSRADRSPWVVGEIADKVAANYIRMRYNLMPTFYTLAYQNYRDGLPIARRLDFYYPAYEESKDNTQYLLGENVIVAPYYNSVTFASVIPTGWLTDENGAPGLKATYYRGTELSGDPVYSCTVDKLEFDWGTGSPHTSVPGDNFSAVYEGYVTLGNAGEGQMRISAQSDDGVRVYVDDKLVIDNWNASDSVEITGSELYESGTRHKLRVEYFEAGGGAKLYLKSQRYIPGMVADMVPSAWLTDKNGNPGLTASYYNNTKMSGTPVVKTTDPRVYFQWATGAPRDGVSADNFSVVWEGTLTVKSDYDCRLGTVSDDGIRVYIDGKCVIDNWQASDSVMLLTDARFKAHSTHSVRIEYYEGSGNAVCKFLFIEDTDFACTVTEDRDVFLPDGKWMDVFTGEVYTGPVTVTVSKTIEQSPLFVKLGSLTVLTDVHDYTDTAQWSALTLDVYTDTEADFSTVLYEDDGDTNGYKSGDYRLTNYRLTCKDGKTTVTVSPQATKYTGEFTERTYTLRIHGQSVKSVTVNGQAVDFRKLPRDSAQMPFNTTAAAPDGDIVTCTFTVPVDAAVTVTVE